nr:hypothetical protein [Streptomyces gossypiisoli]
MNRVGLGLAVGAGYDLGRTRKLKRMNPGPRALADLVSGRLRNNPQFKELGDQLRQDLRGIGGAATGALLERQLDTLADRLHDRTARLRERLSEAVPEGRDLGYGEKEPADDERDAEEPDAEEPDAGEWAGDGPDAGERAAGEPDDAERYVDEPHGEEPDDVERDAEEPVLLVIEYYPKGLFEKTGNLWRAQGRRGEIRDGEVVHGHEPRAEGEPGAQKETEEPDETEETRDTEEPEEIDDEYRDEYADARSRR